MNRLSSSTNKKGKAFLAIFSRGIPVMPDVTNRHTPKGGVRVPMQILMHTIMPKCSGSTPSLRISGNRIGVKITCAAMLSKKQPTISSRMLMRKRMTI